MTSKVEMGLRDELQDCERLLFDVREEADGLYGRINELEADLRTADKHSDSLQAQIDEALAALRSLRQDAARFEWYFSDKPKGLFVPLYMKGLHEHWSLDQWRSAIDSCLQADKGER